MKLKFNGILALLLVLLAQISFAQGTPVTGVVQDATGLPIPGVNVIVKGTTNGVQTDIDGKFAINATSGQVLVFSFLGLKTTELPARSNMNVQMADDSVVLEGVVVTALGIRKNKDQLTSAQQTVSSREITQALNPNVIQSLTGKISGLQINNSTGGVNGTQRIQFRGARSLTGNNEALIVIDNAISTAAVLQQLPPETIESVNAVKGPQGAALYGEQGSNGVLIVTTKRGTKSEKLSVSVNSSVDFETVSFTPDRQQKYGQGWDGEQVPYENGGWGALLDGSYVDTGLTQADGTVFSLPYVAIKDNYKDFYRTGVTKQNSVTLNAGGEDSYALLTASNVNTEFIVKGDELNRNSFLFKAGKRLGKFRLDGTVNYAAQRTKQANAEDNRNGILNSLYQSATNIPVGLFENSGAQGWTAYYKSPYWVRDNNRLNRNQTTVNAIGSLAYDFNKNISVQYTANLRVNSNTGQSYINEYIDEVQEGQGDLSQTSEFYSNQSNTRAYYGDLLVNLNYMLTDDISLKVNLGNNVQDNVFRITSQGGTNLDVEGWYNIKNVLSPAQPSSLDNRYVRSRRVAVFGNMDLGYKNYLYLNVTARQEATSTLDENNRSYFYPSAGLSFIPTKAFKVEDKIINYAKVSASIVKIGNSSGVGAYAINDIGVFPTGFPYGNNSSYINNQNPTDPLISPEFITSKEVGLSLGFFNNRITLDAAAYRSDTKDLINTSSTSSASGLRTLLSNVGGLKTEGLEIDLGLTPIKTEDFRWDLRGSFTTYKSIVTSLADGATQVNLFTANSTRNADGFAVSNIAAGIFAEVGQEFPIIKGTALTRDANGSVIIGEDGLPLVNSTFTNLGNVTPDYILGLSTSFEYKGFRLSAVMDYRTGNKVISETKYNLTWTGHLEESADFDRDLGFIYPNSVTPDPTTGNLVPNTSVYSAAGYGGNGAINYYDRLSKTGENNVIDASAFRVRELALSYALPDKYFDNTGLTGIKFGVNARNPFIVLAKSNKGYGDPESDNIIRSASSNSALRASGNTSANGLGYMGTGNYPSTRSFGMSVNLTFLKKMKMKKIIYLFTLTLAFVSCSDYLDVNETTNNPLASEVPPRLVLPGAQTSAFRIQSVTMNTLGSLMTNSWGANVNAFTGANSREYTQNFDNTFYAGIWDGLYTSVNNFDKIINDPTPNQENYKAISMILKSYYMQYIVDLYGDAPYFEAFKGVNNLTPAYTDDRLIYRDLVLQIEEARNLIANSPDAEEAVTDVMFGGNMEAWVSFANTLELRILLRQSNLTDAETVTYRDTKLAELAALNDFVTSDVTINPGFSAINDDQQNPFFGTLVNTAGQAQQTYNATTASGHIATFLNGTQTGPYNTAGLIDPRRGRMFTLINGEVSGVIQGDVTIVAGGNAPTTVSKLGYGLTGLVNGSAGGGKGSVDNGSSRNGFVMLAAESFFLQAEAAVRYPAIFTESAQSLFNQGITASFAFYSPSYEGASVAVNTPIDAAPYIAASDSYDGIGWNGSSDKIKAIITQKWIALAGVHGIEPFLDLIRTGYPVTPLALTAAPGATKPKRLLYPQSEYTANSGNVPNLTLSQIFIEGAFWTN